MPDKRIFFTNGGGRFGNQLMNQAHFIAFAKEYKDSYRIVNLPFWKYESLFEKNHSTKRTVSELFLYKLLNIFPPLLRPYVENYSAVLIQALHRIVPGYSAFVMGVRGSTYKWISGKYSKTGTLDDTSFLKMIERYSSIALAGWPIRSWVLFEKHQDEIRQTLKINTRYYSVAEKFISEQRTSADLIIGVFIRQTDYKNWLNGRFYFSISDYEGWMRQLVKLYSEKKIRFVIACDEAIDTSGFNNLDYVFATGAAAVKGHFIESIAELSLCDLILTPPSTFSMWAAFMGKVPVLPVTSADTLLSESSIFKNSIQDAIRHPELSLAVR